MNKIFTLLAAFMLLTGFGAAMNKGELIDRIADDADLETIEATWNSEKDGDGESSAVAVVATGHGDDVRKTIEGTWNAEKDGDGESSAEKVSTTASGHGDDVKTVAVTMEMEDGNGDGKVTVVLNNGNLPGFPANWDSKTIPNNGNDDGDKVAPYDPPTLETGTSGGDGDVASRERAKENGRKTVRPEDLVAVASGHGDDVSDAATLSVETNRRPTVHYVATGHGDEVQKTIEGTWNAEKDGDGESSATTVVIPNNGNLPGFPANWDSKTIPGNGNAVVFVHLSGLIDEIRDDDEVTFERKEGRKGMNAVDVRRTGLRDPDDDGDGLPDEVEGATLTWDTADGDAGEYTLTIQLPSSTTEEVNYIVITAEDADGDTDEDSRKVGTVGEAIEYLEKNAKDEE